MRDKYKKILDILGSHRQMVFMSGPRQCGKTTFAQWVLKQEGGGLYLNWDIDEDRRKILERVNLFTSFDFSSSTKPLVVFDEIHKFKDWKNFLKGLYDKYSAHVRILVTGSGRLDFFQKGKDSLAGRYFLFHLWPFTLAEFSKVSRKLIDFEQDPYFTSKLTNQNETEMRAIWENLTRFSGFPDPFTKADDRFYRVWSNTYRNQLIREDIQQLSRLEKIDHLESLVLLLPSKIGSPISMDNLAKDISVSFDTVKKWLLLLERYHVAFRLLPWTKKIGRSVSKERKLYLFNFAEIQDLGARFENMIAIELLSAVSKWQETGEGNYSLCYVRDRDKNEVDFLIVKNQSPLILVEAKLGDENPSKSLMKIQSQLNIPAIQLVQKPNCKKMFLNGANKILVCDAVTWISSLP
jgi:predicted AAA+ superfamily ATPase